MNGLDGINLELSRAYIIVSNLLGHWERFPPISEIVTHPAKFKSPFLSDQFELRTEWRMEDILYCTIPKGRKQAVIALPQFLKIPQNRELMFDHCSGSLTSDTLHWCHESKFEFAGLIVGIGNDATRSVAG